MMRPLMPISPARDGVPFYAYPHEMPLSESENNFKSNYLNTAFFQEQSVRLVFFLPPKSQCALLGLPVLFKQQKFIGVYTELFFELSEYIKRNENRVRGKEKSMKKVSTSTLFSLFLLGKLCPFWYGPSLVKVTVLLHFEGDRLFFPVT